MRYRRLGKSGLQVSEVGLGCEYLEGKTYEQIQAVVDAALEAGINIFDVFMAEPQVRSNIGRALRGRREQVVIQGHIGAAWDGQYTRTRDIQSCRDYFQDLLDRLETNYIDIGMIHNVDEQQDYDGIFSSEIIEFAKEMKANGTIKSIGISTHTPAIGMQAAKTGLIDVILFSANPAYDMVPADTNIDSLFVPATFQSETLLGMDPSREAFYRTCEALDIGVTIMKGLAAGMLMNPKTTPFTQPMTVTQLVHYALTRPAVTSILVGCQSVEEIAAAVYYEQASDEERDFGAVLSHSPRYSIQGKCMYCNHCLPCPMHVNVAQVNQYLDLALAAGAVPPTVKEHYFAMQTQASDCIECGACEGRCPFNVPVIERMQKAKEVFGG